MFGVEREIDLTRKNKIQSTGGGQLLGHYWPDEDRIRKIHFWSFHQAQRQRCQILN